MTGRSPLDVKNRHKSLLTHNRHKLNNAIAQKEDKFEESNYASYNTLNTEGLDLHSPQMTLYEKFGLPPPHFGYPQGLEFSPSSEMSPNFSYASSFSLPSPLEFPSQPISTSKLSRTFPLPTLKKLKFQQSHTPQSDHPVTSHPNQTSSYAKPLPFNDFVIESASQRNKQIMNSNAQMTSPRNNHPAYASHMYEEGLHRDRYEQRSDNASKSSSSKDINSSAASSESSSYPTRNAANNTQSTWDHNTSSNSNSNMNKTTTYRKGTANTNNDTTTNSTTNNSIDSKDSLTLLDGRKLIVVPNHPYLYYDKDHPAVKEMFLREI